MNEPHFELSPHFLEGQQAEAGGIVFEVMKKSLAWHEEFSHRWSRETGFPSYHNENHVKAVLQSGMLLLEKAFGTKDDPLGVANSLNRWNKIHGVNLEYGDLVSAFLLATSTHDLGNIGELMDGQFTFFPDGKYKAKGAEDRSKAILRKELSRLSDSNPLGQEIVDLAEHLVGETTFMFGENSEAPFRLFMRVCDQIGGNLFNGQDNFVEGLVAEMQFENPEGMIADPDRFINFIPRRMGELIREGAEKDSDGIEGQDLEVIDKILGIWGKTMPVAQSLSGLNQDKQGNLLPVRYEVFLEKLRTNESS
jgi:hypothetical protein